MPDRQTPLVAITSQGGRPSSPCTIAAWLGITWSGMEVPQARMSTAGRPTVWSSRRTAAAVSWALLWVAFPVAGSMA
ncbi:MAG: hypothetical protein K0R83_1126 [Caulobacter sp.]|nr:hypothetical protein [Caulobacter sp.]